MSPERVLFEALFQVVHLLSLQERGVVEPMHRVVVTLARGVVGIIEHCADGSRRFACAPDPMGASE